LWQGHRYVLVWQVTSAELIAITWRLGDSANIITRREHEGRFESVGIAMSLQELEAAVSQLPAAELNLFAQWFEEYLAGIWDRRIESDIKAGRLDDAGRRADADFDAGRCKPL